MDRETGGDRRSATQKTSRSGFNDADINLWAFCILKGCNVTRKLLGPKSVCIWGVVAKPRCKWKAREWTPPRGPINQKFLVERRLLCTYFNAPSGHKLWANNRATVCGLEGGSSRPQQWCIVMANLVDARLPFNCVIFQLQPHDNVKTRFLHHNRLN